MSLPILRGAAKQRKILTSACALFVTLHNCRGEVAALRKLKKEWEACGTVVTDLCATMAAAMDETDVRVTKVGVPW